MSKVELRKEGSSNLLAGKDEFRYGTAVSCVKRELVKEKEKEKLKRVWGEYKKEKFKLMVRIRKHKKDIVKIRRRYLKYRKNKLIGLIRDKNIKLKRRYINIKLKIKYKEKKLKLLKRCKEYKREILKLRRIYKEKENKILKKKSRSRFFKEAFFFGKKRVREGDKIRKERGLVGLKNKVDKAPMKYKRRFMVCMEKPDMLMEEYWRWMGIRNMRREYKVREIEKEKSVVSGGRQIYTIGGYKDNIFMYNLERMRELTKVRSLGYYYYTAGEYEIKVYKHYRRLREVRGKILKKLRGLIRKKGKRKWMKRSLLWSNKGKKSVKRKWEELKKEVGIARIPVKKWEKSWDKSVYGSYLKEYLSLKLVSINKEHWNSEMGYICKILVGMPYNRLVEGENRRIRFGKAYRIKRNKMRYGREYKNRYNREGKLFPIVYQREKMEREIKKGTINVTAKMILGMFRRSIMRDRRNLFKVIREVRNIMRNYQIRDYYMEIKGRYARRSTKKKSILRYVIGDVKRSDMYRSKSLEFAEGGVILRKGYCGIKIYMKLKEGRTNVNVKKVEKKTEYNKMKTKFRIGKRSVKLYEGVIGLKAMESGNMRAKEYTTLKRKLERSLKGKGRVIFRVGSAIGKTSKGIGSRMGKGKGEISEWAYRIEKNSVFVEVIGKEGFFEKSSILNSLGEVSKGISLKTKVVLSKV